jgi:hypothetical protein
MNYNVIGYIVFFVVMFYVIAVVGWKLYIYGRPFLVENMGDELHLVDPVNKLLLVGYYIFNLGYVALSIQDWAVIRTIPELINTLGYKTGGIIILLGIVHYFNLIWLSLLHKVIEKINQINSYK